MAVLRWLQVLGVVCLLVTVCMPGWADGAADEVAHANQLIDDGKYAEAIAILTPLTSSPEPVGRQAKQALEGCYRRAGQWEKAIAILESFVRDYPPETPGWQTLLAGCYAGLGNHTKAFEAVKAGLEFTPTTSGARAALVAHLWRCCTATKDWTAGAAVFRSLLTKQPDNALEWQYRLHSCYREMGKSAEAAAELGKAKKMTESDPEQQIVLAEMLITDTWYDDAAEILLPITGTTGPTSRLAKESLDGCYRRAKQWEKAIAVLESLAREFPADTPGWQARIASCYAGLGQHAKSIAAAKAGLEFTPITTAARGILAEHLWRGYTATDDWNAAAATFLWLADKQPEGVAEWHYSLGRCYRKLGRKADALTAMDKAMELAKDDKAAITRMAQDVALVYYSNGKFAKAEELLRSVSARASVVTHMMRSLYDLQNSGECAVAIDGFRYAIERFPDFPGFLESAHVCVAECLQSLGKLSEAKAYAKKMYDDYPELRGGALFAEGIVCLWADEFEASANAFRRLLAEYPTNQHAALARPYYPSALAKAGRLDEAAEVLQKMASEAPDASAKAQHLLKIGVMYQDANKPQNAIAAFRLVREMSDAPGGMKAEATYRSGVCYKAISYDSSAQTCMEQVTKLYPDSEWAKNARGLLFVWSNYAQPAPK